MREILDGKKGVIMDADGTLLDSDRAWASAARSFLEGRSLAISMDPVDAYYSFGYNALLHLIVEEHPFLGSASDLNMMIKKTLLSFYRESVEEIPGARSFLSELKERGMKLCLLTSNSSFLVAPALERLGMLQLFDQTIYAEEAGVTKKDESALSLAVEMLGLGAKECVLFEDQWSVLETGRTMGMATVAVDYRRSGRERDFSRLAGSSDAVISDYSAIV